MPIAIRVGSTLPLLDSAVGLVFVSFVSRAVVDDALAVQIEQGTTHKKTKKEIASLRDDLLADGYARTKDQMILGLSALAAPVFNAAGQLELAIGMVIPARLDDAEIGILGPLLRETADRASAELGHSPVDP